MNPSISPTLPTPPLSPATRIAGWRSAVGLAVYLGLCFSAAAFGAQFMPGEWYRSLNKPAWNPPAWVFGPVWTTLYIMMAVAAWRIWRQGGFTRNALPLSLFLAQLFLNALWSWAFFGLKNPALAFLDLVLLWLALSAALLQFWRRERVAAGLLVPYLAWVTFAGALNLALWRLNAT